ncbi:MAG: N-acetyltransferase [Chloroflexi bacterium]|nr:N-acetyltransferase [Chloroflexota bacterium]
MILLREITDAEFSEYKQMLIEEYAQDVSHNYRIPLEEAHAHSASQINVMLHQGLSTPNQFLYTIRQREDPTEVQIGYLWLDVNDMKHSCTLCDIFLFKDSRGKGWGRKTLEVLETLMAERGIRKINLHVFASNSVAHLLYVKLGYQVTGLNMKKWL